MAREKFSLVLESSKMVADAVKHLVFKKENGEALSYIPGQFINFHFEHEGAPLQRSYSIANQPNAENTLEIAISHVSGGKATALFFGMEPGDSVQASGPVGRLILKEADPKRYVLIATGTGVAPYRAMLDELSKRFKDDPELNVDLLLGVRHRVDLLYADDFRAFAANHPQFRFHACLSREATDNQCHDEYLGKRVTELLSGLDLNPEQDVVYLCGNPDMIDEAFEQCKTHGFDNKTVRREKYVLSK